MNIAIRTDASARIGLGHLARCRTLAAALREQGATVHFICRAHPGHQIDALRAEGYRVTALPAPPLRDAADADYAAWLGVTQAQDAAETLAAIKAQPATNKQQQTTNHKQPTTNHLIIDHYALDTTWEQHLRPAVHRSLVIDDLANRPHDCDLLLDQNFAADAEARYAHLLQPQAQCLLGPRYALLRPEYAQARQRLHRCTSGQPNNTETMRGQSEPVQSAPVQSDHAGPLSPESTMIQAVTADPTPVRRVLVFFGGTDPDDLSGRALQALSHPTLAQLHVDLVVGANNPHRDRLAAQAEARGNTQLHPPRPHLADLMAQADLAIGAGGATTWERCCLGLPSLVVSIAQNQRPACEALVTAGVIDYLGHKDAVTAEQLRHALRAVLDHPEQRRRLTRTGADLVDGQGTRRVIRAMQAADSARFDQ